MKPQIMKTTYLIIGFIGIAAIISSYSCKAPLVPNASSTAIDQYIRSLPFLKQKQVLSDPSRIGSPTPEEEYDVGDQRYVCKAQKYKVAPEYDEQLSLNPTTDVIWLGSIIDGSTIDDGGYRPITLPRGPLTFSISLEHIEGAVSRTVEDPKLSSIRQATKEILAQNVTGSTVAQVTFSIEDIYSETQFQSALGVSYTAGLQKVKANFDFDNKTVISRKVVKFMQIYYTLDLDTPEKPSDFLGSSLTVESLHSQINETTVPLYVSSIAYGRMALFCVESDYSKQELHAALAAAVSNVKGDISTEHKKVLQRSSIKATIIGGDGATAVGVVDGFPGMVQYMKTGGNYNKDTAAAPLAYKLRRLSDNTVQRVVIASDYQVRTCNRLNHARFEIIADAAGAIMENIRFDYTKRNGERVEYGSKRVYAGGTWWPELPPGARDFKFSVDLEGDFKGYQCRRKLPRKYEDGCWRITIGGSLHFPKCKIEPSPCK